MSEEGYQVALKRIEKAAQENSTQLDLTSLGLATLPLELFNLSDLLTLDLSGNQITEIPEAIGNLSNLQELSISNNQIKEIPEAIGNLSNLQLLRLNINQIETIPEALGKLSNLQELRLSDNQIRSIPNSLGKLSNLESLSIFGNQITAIPEALGNLANLRDLHVQNNQIKGIPESLGNLPNLRVLFLDGNQITAIPESFGNLSNLQILFLDGNQITAIPESVRNIKKLSHLYLHSNYGLGIPAEVLGPHWRKDTQTQANPAEILEYYFRAQKTGRPLNEAKLILVGRGAVGKSSLVEKLIHNTFTAGKTKTEGIDIKRWEIPIESEIIRLNVWDFGGQEIMHATHQFFLTERSLYLLVLNGRDGSEEADAEYWLKLIESFGANSPVIIALNKIREHPFNLN